MFLRVCVLLLSLLFLSSCSPNKPKEPIATNILAIVGSEQISSDDLDTAIIRTLGEYASYRIDDKGRKKVLQSLVLGKAMALTQQKQMTKDEIKQLNNMVAAYKEELLIKRYLQQNITPLPVTNKMVKNYYQQHPENFGGKTIKSFEMIKTTIQLKGAARERIISVMDTLATDKHWSSAVNSLKSKGLALQYSKGSVAQGVLKSDIDNIIQKLAVEEISPVSVIKGIAYIIRITDEKAIAPKPLSEVTHKIKKILAPLQLKKAVKAEADKLLTQIKVVYLNDPEQIK